MLLPHFQDCPTQKVHSKQYRTYTTKHRTCDYGVLGWWFPLFAVVFGSTQRWRFCPAKQCLELLRLNLLKDQYSISLSLPVCACIVPIPLKLLHSFSGEFPSLGTDCVQWKHSTSRSISSKTMKVEGIRVDMSEKTWQRTTTILVRFMMYRWRSVEKGAGWFTWYQPLNSMFIYIDCVFFCKTCSLPCRRQFDLVFYVYVECSCAFRSNHFMLLSVTFVRSFLSKKRVQLRAVV